MYKLDYFCAKQIMTARPRDAHFSHFSREREMVLRDISREKCGCEKLRENRPFLANFWSNLTKIWPKLEVLSYKVISVLLSITLTVEFWWSYWSFNRIYDLLYIVEKFIKKDCFRSSPFTEQIVSCISRIFSREMGQYFSHLARNQKREKCACLATSLPYLLKDLSFSIW